MIQSDSLKQISDSTNGLPSDSLANLDTLLKADSTQLVDSIKAIIQAPSGHLGIPHPPVPQTDSWVFGTILLLFLVFVFSLSRSSNAISETIKTFFQSKERGNLFGKATISNFGFRFFLIQFSIGVISLYAYLYFLTDGQAFSIVTYAYFYISTSLFFGIKSVLSEILGYVFFNAKDLKQAKDSYFNIVSLLGVVLFPVIIFQVYLPYNIEYSTHILSISIFALGYLLLVIKLFQIFFDKIVASFYILLYLCTLEILPLFALYQVYNLIR